MEILSLIQIVVMKELPEFLTVPVSLFRIQVTISQILSHIRYESPSMYFSQLVREQQLASSRDDRSSVDDSLAIK